MSGDKHRRVITIDSAIRQAFVIVRYDSLVDGWNEHLGALADDTTAIVKTGFGN